MRKQSVEIKRLNQEILKNFVVSAGKINGSELINHLNLTLTNLNYKFGRLGVGCWVFNIIMHIRHSCQLN